ncbi:hydrogenase [bacterium]|nr:hydrogenase [bacterium]
MTNLWIDLLCLLLMLANFRMLGVSRLGACVRTAAHQGMLLCLLPVLVAHDFTLGLVPVVLLGLIVRGILMPRLLWRAVLKAGVRRELVPEVGFLFSLLAGVVLLGLCFLIAQPLQADQATARTLALPVALFTIMTGFYLIIMRRTAAMQALGYLVMENGIFAFGAVFAVHEPALIEMGVLLDVLLAVFIMTIMIHHIGREFDHLDTDSMSVLKD